MSRLDEEFNIIGVSNLFLALLILKRGWIDAIFGPKGGIVVLDENDCLIIRKPHDGYKGIYFSIDDYLSLNWKWLIDRFKRAINVTPTENSAKLSQNTADKKDKESILDEKIFKLCNSCSVNRCPGPCEEYTELLDNYKEEVESYED